MTVVFRLSDLLHDTIVDRAIGEAWTTARTKWTA
jgi:hypothetical protein